MSTYIIPEFDNILKYVEQKLSNDIKSRHFRNYERDCIKTIESACRNRRFRKRKRKIHHKERKKNWLKKRQITMSAKANSHDQNTINISNKELSSTCKSLLTKGPNFVPAPYDINWYTFKTI